MTPILVILAYQNPNNFTMADVCIMSFTSQKDEKKLYFGVYVGIKVELNNKMLVPYIYAMQYVLKNLF